MPRCLLLLTILLPITIFGQQAITYYPNEWKSSLYSDYDSASIFLTISNADSVTRLTKMNGAMNPIWSIDMDNTWTPSDLKKLNDGSTVICGTTQYLGNEGNPYVMKLNPCYEPEWCKVMRMKEIATGSKLLVTENDEIILLTEGEDTYHEEARKLNEPQQTVYGYRFNAQGNILWRKRLFHEFNIGSTVQSAYLLQDKIFLIGSAFYGHPLFPGDMVFKRSFTMVTDTALNTVHYWHNDTNTYYDGAYNLTPVDSGNFACFRAGTLYDTPLPGDEKDIGYLTKLDANLNIIYQRGYTIGDTNTIYYGLTAFSDSSKFLSVTLQRQQVSQSRYHNRYFVNIESAGSFKTLQTKHLDALPEDTNISVSNLEARQLPDGSILICGSLYHLTTQKPTAFIIRLSETLAYDTAVVDSIATTDYKCNKTIVSNTVQIDNIDTLYFPQLVTGITTTTPPDQHVVIYPVPAQTTVRISSTAAVKELTILDISGKVWMKTTYEKDDTETIVDVSSLPPGMYYAACLTERGISVQKMNILR